MIGTRIHLGILLISVLGAGCGDGEGPRSATTDGDMPDGPIDAPADVDADGLADMGSEAGEPEGGAPRADAGPERTAIDGLRATSDAERGDLGYDPSTGDFDGEARTGGDATACYDRIDGDDSDGIDCADPSCHVLRSCCVGSGDCCAAADDWLGSAIDLSDETTCEGAGEPMAATCLAGAGFDVTGFGSPSSFVAGDGLHPGGDATGDSGLLLGSGTIDLRTHRVAIETDFTPATGCGASCLEGVAVGLTTQDDLDSAGEDAHVRATVGLTLSSSRERVSLVVAGEVVASRAHAEGRWRLVVRPDGRVTAEALESAETDVIQAQLVPEAGARLVLWGRNRNTEETRAHVGYVSAQVSLCDNPTVWPVRRPIVLREAGISEPATIGGVDNPSIAHGADGSTWLAFDAPTGPEGTRAIHLAERTASAEPNSFALRPPSSSVVAETPVLEGSHTHDRGGMRDPELVWMGGTQLVMLYTAIAEDETRSIGRASWDDDAGAWITDDVPVLEDDSLEYSEPTVARRDRDHWIMAVRVDDGSGEPRAELYHSDDDAAGTIWSPDFADTELDRQLRRPGQRAPMYDADAVGATSLAIHDGAWQLYYARRRGTRWSVGLVASHELIFWRHVDEGAAVLEQGPNDFDRLGARSPDALGAGNLVEVVYVGLDGTEGSLGIARRPAAAMGSFP